jgi:hypothetical protein
LDKWREHIIQRRAARRDRDRLSEHDKSIIGRARHLAGVSGTAAIRAYFGTTAVSCADTMHAYAEALGQATRVIGELLAIIERLADAGPESVVGLPGGLMEV